MAEARHAEEVGFDLVTVWDHLHGDRPSSETWTLLAWMAASTSRIALGTNVLGLPYRSPAVLAKMGETFDRLSGGRLVLGLGAGGNDREFAAFGLPVWSPAEKVEALTEAIDVIRGLWSEPQFSYEGKHFRTAGLEVEPKPERRIPIWIGAYGRRMLALVGRAADGWLPSMPYAPPREAGERMRIVRDAATAAGRDPAEIAFAYNVPVRVGSGPAQDPDRMVAGEPGPVVERLAELLRIGFTCLNFWVSGDRGEQRERLAREVIPAVRELAG